MTCRHSADDSSCSSHPNYRDPNLPRQVYVPGHYEPADKVPETPDSKNYSIEKVERIGKHLVLQVKYPNCAKCAYEGNKVMVFLNVSEADVIRWREIDPHFRSDKNRKTEQAPSPAARFPASDAGWADAVAYARGKDDGKLFYKTGDGKTGEVKCLT